MRRGFSLVYAIFVVVLMGSLMVYSLNISSEGAKTASDEHIKMQMKLYKESAIELTMLWMSGDKARSEKNGSLNIRFDDKYDFNISITTLDVKEIKESIGTVMADIVGSTNFLNENYAITERVVLKP